MARIHLFDNQPAEKHLFTPVDPLPRKMWSAPPLVLPQPFNAGTQRHTIPATLSPGAYYPEPAVCPRLPSG